MRQLTYHIILLLLLLPMAAMAEVADYPCRELISAGAYSQAKTELLQQQAQTPDNHAVYFALYKLTIARNNPDRNVKQAYEYLCLSQDKLSAYPKKDISRAERNGYTEQQYATEYANIALLAQLSAQQKNTLEVWNDYISTYQRAPRKQMVQAMKTRDAIAFRQAERTNTREAYQAFIESYPEAQERAEAQKRLYGLEYSAIAETGTEKDLKQYCETHPESPYVDKALDRIAELEMRRLARPDAWQLQRDYLLTHTDSTNRWRDTAMISYVQLVQRSQVIEAARWGMMNLPKPYSDSCWLVYRETCLQDTALGEFVKFHNNFHKYAIERVQKDDRRLMEAYDQFRLGAIGVHEYIDKVAPAYPAYYRLQELIQDDLKAKRWSSALATVKAHAAAFGNDYRYSELVRVLEEQDDPKMAVTPLGSGVNTPDGNEFCPVISTDGTQLYFCGTKRKDNKGREDIFLSTKTPNGWGKAVAVNDINTADANEAPLGLTTDGLTMIIFRNGRLMISHRTKDGWGKLEPLSRHITISEWMADAMITADGKALLFAAMSKVPHEHEMSINIFVSLLQPNGTWGRPFGLGPQINSTRIDRSPFLHPDMKTLYFCSEGHSSLGGTDVFVSKRLNDNSWTEWSQPVNMGKVINSAANECWYKISTEGDLAYFANRTNKQNDLCQLTIRKELRPQAVATITGRVTDSQGKPVNAIIQWEDLEAQCSVGQTRTNPEDGKFFMVLPEGKNYGYYIQNDKFFPAAQNIDLRNNAQPVTIEQDIAATTIEEMIEQEVPIVLNNLFFRTGEYDLLPASIAELNRVAAIIKQHGKNVEISGHTDSVGDDESNRVLSEYRANSVRNYLIKIGVDKALLTSQGYGESKPVATNNTPEGRQKNRRVEMKFIK